MCTCLVARHRNRSLSFMKYESNSSNDRLCPNYLSRRQPQQPRQAMGNWDGNVWRTWGMKGCRLEAINHLSISSPGYITRLIRYKLAYLLCDISSFTRKIIELLIRKIRGFHGRPDTKHNILLCVHPDKASAVSVITSITLDVRRIIQELFLRNRRRRCK